MLKHAEISIDQIREASQVDDGIAVEVFKMLHGCYGNLFLSKFASGVLDSKGRDKGTASARRVWAMKLAAYSSDVVGTALDRCQQHHPEFPPSLPQFLAICEAAAPKEYFTAPPALPMSAELKARQAEERRVARLQHLAAARAAVSGPVVIEATGLDVLKQCIANASGIAGGDEAAELLRLDRLLAPRENQ